MAAKISISMNEVLLERVDKYCEDNFQNRSGLIAIALKSYLDSQEVLPKFKELADALTELQKKSEKTE